MPKRYYRSGFTFDHIRAVSNALDKHNLPRDIKRVIFKHYKRHYRYKPTEMYREPTIYERVQHLRNVRRHGA